MTAYYMDAGSGASGNTGLSWAQAMDTLSNLIAKMSAGDIGYIRQGTTDNYATAVTFTSPGDDVSGITLVGVKSGTVAEPPAKSDMSVRGTDTLARITTNTAQTLYFENGFTLYGLDFDTGSAILGLQAGSWVRAFGCRFDSGGSNLRLWGNNNYLQAWDCEFAGSVMEPTGFAGALEVTGGEITMTSVNYAIACTNYIGRVILKGVDFSGGSSNNIFEGGIGDGDFHAENCKLKTGMGLTNGAPTRFNLLLRAVGCSDNTAAKGSGTSYQEYESATPAGTVDIETTAVRTNGSDDGASGGYSFALTPYVSETRETLQFVSSPWLRAWVPGGASKTLTVYIANSGAADYNEDDVWCEFLTPDDGDSAQHDFSIEPDGYKGAADLNSATAIPDDTGSTWGTGGNNPQKFEFTTTPGFEGWVLARVHFAKRFTSSPETLYVDGLIGGT